MSVSPVKHSAKVPVRTCVGCRMRAPKAELLRVVADDRGEGLEAVPDPRGRAPGRGAHLHPTPECVEQALRRRALSRALKVGTGLAGSRLQTYVQRFVTDPTEKTRLNNLGSSSS